MVKVSKVMRKNKRFGFTLVELLAVIVILAIILVIAVPKIINVIYDAKVASLESTAKMVASEAEKRKVQNQVLGKEENITCENVTKLNDVDYQNCYIEFVDNQAYVTIEGSGKFEEMYICKGTKNDSKVVDRCPNERVNLEVLLNDGTVSTSQSGIYKEGTIIDLEVPTRENSTFIEYVVVSGNSVLEGNKLTIGSTDTIITAQYETWKKFEVDLAEGTGNTNYKDRYKSGTIIELEEPVREGYTFTGWTAPSGEISGNRFTMGKSDVVVTATWRVNGYAYNIEYKSTSGESLGSETITYNYGTTNTIVPKEIPGYTSPSSQTVSWDSTNAKTINFTYSIITYTITYNLNGGSVSTANKTSYTVETDTFTLNNPTKELYIFTGWTGSNVTTENTNLTIQKGSVGNRSYTANWKSAVVSFAEDDWDIIKKAIATGSYPYKVGDTKTISLGTFGTHTLRIANLTPCSSVSVASKTACGFVIEFATVITKQTMNPSSTTVGGWSTSQLRTYVLNTVYNEFPQDLKNIIINTYVISSNSKSSKGSVSGSNFATTDKLYLLSPQEIYGTSFSDSYDSSNGTSRQLEYYKNLGVTTSANYSYTIKKYNGTASVWWTRSAKNKYDGDFYRVRDEGDWGDYTVTSSYGVAPAFRIAE